MWEAVRVYHYVYGLNPFGPHRPLADRLLAPMRDLCIRCGGRTVLTIDEETWSDCPSCEGTGGVWNRPFDEVDAVWHEVVAQGPGSAMREPAAQAGSLENVTPHHSALGVQLEKHELIDLLRESLGSLHDRRRTVAGSPVECEIRLLILRWERVLDWLKTHPGGHVRLMGGSSSPC